MNAKKSKQTKPKMEPGEEAEAKLTTEEEASMPSAVPPALEALAGAEVEGGPADVDLMTAPEEAAPSLQPAAGVAAGISAWHKNKKITGLWSINQNRNSWVHIAGTGWKKLANNSDTGVVALTMLAAHARVKNSNVNLREENDGMVREMYVW